MAENDHTAQDQWRDITVSVQSDHLTRLARRASPVRAVAELIWNSLDADADVVEVTLREGLLGTLDAIEVRDNGTGMEFQKALDYFGRLGGSWKRPRKTTPKNGRPLHGKLGRGRFLAFGAGKVVEWSTRYQKGEHGISEFKIVADIDNPGRFRLSEPTVVNDDGAGTGTTVRVTQIEKSSLLDQQQSIEPLILEFAPYLKSYPTVALSYNGEKLDPDTSQLGSWNYELWSYPAFTDGWFLGLMVSDVVSFLPRHFTERGNVHRRRCEQPGEVRSASVARALHLRFRPHG